MLKQRASIYLRGSSTSDSIYNSSVKTDAVLERNPLKIHLEANTRA